MTDEQPAPSEATGTQAPCEHCHGPVIPPKRKGLVKRFCSDRCRANHRDQRIQRAVDLLDEVADEVQGELDRLQARLRGARTLLQEALGSKHTRKQKDKKVVDASQVPG